MWLALPLVAQLEAPGPGTVAGLWASRLGTYLSFTLLVGLLTAAAWLLRGSAVSRSALGPPGRTAMRLAVVCAGAWAVSAAGMFFFGLANATARPVTAVFDTTTLGRFLATRYGSGMALQCAVAVGVCLLAAATRDRIFARVALAGTGAGALALASSGHAATARVPPVAVTADALHILGAAAWVGGLVVLAAFVLRRGGHVDVVLPARRFSRLAGYALAVVLASGAVNSLMHVERPGQLLDTSWGRLVLVKLVLFAAIASLGWRNRRFQLPRLGAQEAARSAFRKLAAAEVGLMVLAFGTATAMAQGVPARVEEAARLEAVRVPFADGQVELTLTPARAGVNELHVYFFDDTGGLREVDDAAVTFVGDGATVEARLVDSGPGHYTGPAVDVPAPGRYRAEVAGVADGREHTATATFTLR